MSRKRKYTFSKGEIVPYESGSPMHQIEKAERDAFGRRKKDIES